MPCSIVKAPRQVEPIGLAKKTTWVSDFRICWETQDPSFLTVTIHEKNKLKFKVPCPAVPGIHLVKPLIVRGFKSLTLRKLQYYRINMGTIESVTVVQSWQCYALIKTWLFGYLGY